MRPLARRRLVPRLRGFDYSAPHWYHIVMVTRNRSTILSRIIDDRIELTAVGHLVETEWADRPRWEPGLVLDLFVVMPDHLHAILALPGRGDPLSRVVGRFKAATSRRAVTLGWSQGTIWQRSFYDRVIRDQRELDATRKYIAENPLRCRTVRF